MRNIHAITFDDEPRAKPSLRADRTILGRGLRIAESALRFVDERADAVLQHASGTYSDVLDELACRYDEEYAAIEERRQRGDGLSVFLSETEFLHFEHLEYQCKVRDEISRRLVLHPIFKVINAVKTNGISRPVTELRYALQRVLDGWDETAVWSLDNHIAKNLSEQLAFMAEVSHGWPASEEFPTFESWRDALNLQAERLNRYANDQFDYDLEAWESTYEEAQEAMRWVAENFGLLWT